MKIIFNLFAASAIALTAVACSHKAIEPELQGPVEAEITGGVLTRADGAQWTQDRIGVTVSHTTSGSMSENYRNAGYRTDSEGFSATFTAITGDDVIYFDNSDDVTFSAYAPYKEGSVKELPGTGGVIAGSTLDQSDHTALDYLYASGATANEEDPAVRFAFSHLMSKLVINIRGRGALGATDIQGGTYTLGGLVHSGEFDVTSGTVAVKGGAENLTINGNCPSENTSSGISYTMIVYPQTWTSPLTFSATVGAYSHDATLSEDFSELKAGYTYTYVVSVSESGLIVDDSTLSDWENGGNFGDTVFDLSGETSDVVIDLDGATVTGGTEDEPYTGHITFSEDVTKVTFRDVHIDCDMTSDSGGAAAVTVGKDLTLTLAGSSKITIRTAENVENDCLSVTGCTLVIDGDGSLSMSLDQTGSSYPGGALNLSSGANLIINGGTVTAASGYKYAGIGSGSKGTAGDITINGGEVTATSTGLAAGMGSGTTGKCGNITISGGTVSASNLNNQSGAGIGTGSGGTCGDITISGGSVTALGGGQYSAAIGTGGNGKAQATCGNIVITNGVTSVTATSSASTKPTYVIGPGCQTQEDICGTVYLGGSDATDTSVTTWTTSVLTVTNNAVYGWTYSDGTWTKDND